MIYHNKERLASLEDYAVITATDELYGRGYDFTVNLLEKVDELRPTDVQETIKKLQQMEFQKQVLEDSLAREKVILLEKQKKEPNRI